MDYRLVVMKGRSATQAVRLADGVTTIGRQDGCEVTVRSSQVSRKHCQVFEKKGILLVKDLNSSNGTFVNDRRIEEQRVLEAGDVIAVGPIRFKVEKVQAQAAAPSKVEVAPPEGGEDPSNTAIPEAVDAPIPLDDDDVLDFVMGDDDATEATKPAQSKPKAKAKEEPKPKAKEEPKPKAKAPAPAQKAKAPAPNESKSKPAEPEGEGDDAVADFLMDLKVDDDD